MPLLPWLLAFVTAPSNANTPGRLPAGLVWISPRSRARCAPLGTHAPLRTDAERLPRPRPPCLHGAVRKTPCQRLNARPWKRWFNTPCTWWVRALKNLGERRFRCLPTALFTTRFEPRADLMLSSNFFVRPKNISVKGRNPCKPRLAPSLMTCAS